MASIAARRIDRMLATTPMPLKSIAQIKCKYGKNNECALTFVRDLIPLMAYGNGHLKFVTQDTESAEQEYCQVTLGSGKVVTFNFKLYRYPLQMLQRIIDLAV